MAGCRGTELLMQLSRIADLQFQGQNAMVLPVRVMEAA
jgi:hypothetical protein